MEQSHVAVENTREHRRMLGMKFYVTGTGTHGFLLGYRYGYGYFF